MTPIHGRSHTKGGHRGGVTTRTRSEHEEDRRVAQVALEHYERGFTSTQNTRSTANEATKSKHLSSASLRGKPNPETEWTVYSALVALRHRRLDQDPSRREAGPDEIDDAWVVSCATGTKCTTSRMEGWILHDCHGEVLVRRGLVLALLQEVQRHLLGRDSATTRSGSNRPDSSGVPSSEFRSLLEPVKEEDPTGIRHEGGQPRQHQFRLRSDTTLHLYISDSPCGDASIYELNAPATCSSSDQVEVPKETRDDAAHFPSLRTGLAQFTGSKLVIPSCGDPLAESATERGEGDCPELHVLARSAAGSLIVRETGSHGQLLGRLRSKSSRSNVANRSSSLSCSDKICRWQILGWQGCAVLPLVPDPIRVASVVVSRDPRAASKSELADPTLTARDVESVPADLRCGQNAALQRAIVDRVQVTMTWLRSITEGSSAATDSEYRRRLCRDERFRASVVEAAFASGKSQMLWTQSTDEMSTPSLDVAAPNAVTVLSNRKRRRAEAESTNKNRKKMSPCGVSLNWNVSMGGDALPEVLVGARGVRQGRVPRTEAEHRALASQLCRARLAALTTRVLQASRIAPCVGEGEGEATAPALRNRAFKAAAAPPGYVNVRNQVFRDVASPLAGWLVDEEGDFELSRNDA